MRRICTKKNGDYLEARFFSSILLLLLLLLFLLLELSTTRAATVFSLCPPAISLHTRWEMKNGTHTHRGKKATRNDSDLFTTAFCPVDRYLLVQLLHIIFPPLSAYHYSIPPLPLFLPRFFNITLTLDNTLIAHTHTPNTHIPGLWHTACRNNNKKRHRGPSNKQRRKIALNKIYAFIIWY